MMARARVSEREMTTTRSEVEDAKGLRSRKEQFLQATKFYHEKIKQDEKGRNKKNRQQKREKIERIEIKLSAHTIRMCLVHKQIDEMKV